MKVKLVNKITDGSSEEENQEVRLGLLVYDNNNNEYYINISEDGGLRITLHDGCISLSPQSMNQVTLCPKK